MLQKLKYTYCQSRRLAGIWSMLYIMCHFRRDKGKSVTR
ncbi:hypothetical protein MTBPR1_70034 [Candidatus Terasakiella magnetica]|uniref:Uncharacterized protein n=1 Tax=Candidatus Terasakiella magnetica TaxID=1867952 RepID=A0A1C3RKB9_9PROT|nr:hypothetical protein MTBPR1_70034 [Candidatus Terasakiella magnetica]